MSVQQQKYFGLHFDYSAQCVAVSGSYILHTHTHTPWLQTQVCNHTTFDRHYSSLDNKWCQVEPYVTDISKTKARAALNAINLNGEVKHLWPFVKCCLTLCYPSPLPHLCSFNNPRRYHSRLEQIIQHKWKELICPPVITLRCSVQAVWLN